MKKRAVKVKWVDPYSIDEWTSISSDEEPALFIESFGYEVHRGEKTTTIALSIDEENGKMACATVIPNECIKSYEVMDDERD